MRFPFADRSTSRTNLDKIWNKGIGSLMPCISGAMFRHLQKRLHWRQAVASFWETVKEKLSESACCAACELYAACNCMEGRSYANDCSVVNTLGSRRGRDSRIVE